MTDRELMQFRFSRKNVRKSTGQLAQLVGMPRKDFEAAVKRGMNAENQKEGQSDGQSS